MLHRLSLHPIRFNPHPTFLPGDASCMVRNSRNIRDVSIHTRHFCRVMPRAAQIRGPRDAVSIHTRHFCRVMLWCLPERTPTQWSFNPHPTFLPGDARSFFDVRGNWGVSIHTRHFCRVMQGPPVHRVLFSWFQSTPDISAG